jgi:hypothetical protein
MSIRQDSTVARIARRGVGWVVAPLLLLALIFAACQPTAPAAPVAEVPATPPPAQAEEAAATPTPAPEEAVAVTPTPAQEEEAAATPTPAPEEEAAATPTPAAEEEESAMPGEIEAGAYFFTIARGCGCHFNRDLGALAGGNRFEVGGNVVYAANITPHSETGLGAWSVEEVVTVLRTGERPDGSQLHPIMPYRAYSVLSDEDATHLANYLLAQEPMENDVPAREMQAEPASFTPDPAPPAEAPTEPVDRGAYLVSIARCGDCHTPRNPDGTPNLDLYLAGNRINEDEVAWNITPHETTGIGFLSDEEIATFLRTGHFPDGSQVVGIMGTLIERYFSSLTGSDALAIAAYLKSIPPVDHDPE